MEKEWNNKIMANSLITSITGAIAQMEGSNPSTNNPGNIMDLAYYKQTGQFRVQQYPTPQAGQDALESLTNSYINKGYSLNDFFAKYAPTGHGNNNPVAYAQFVAGKVGVDPNVPLNQVGGVPTYTITGYGVAPTDVLVAGEATTGQDSLFGAMEPPYPQEEAGVDSGSGMGVSVLGWALGLGLLVFLVSRR
jgi:hypothetical protein